MTDAILQKSIAILGFMAAGKSRIGRALAKRLGLAFADTDSIIQDSFGLSVADIFRERGEAEFREAERQVIHQLLLADVQVISLGGGAFIDPVNRDLLNSRANTIWLDPSFEQILQRLRRSSGRPLAANKTEDELRSLWADRRQYYAKAQIRIEASCADPDAIVERIISALDRS
jgi:shikimate kinase